MLTRMVVVADDLTGACDTGLQFSKRGLETMVLHEFDEAAGAWGKTDVVVIDTESREDQPEIAYEKVRRVSKVIKKAGLRSVYKKVDSTLRGNIGPELDAVMDTLPFEAAIIAPAFPDNHRVTTGGFQIVCGDRNRGVDGGDRGRAPLHIPTLLKNQTERSVGTVNLMRVREGVNRLYEAIKREVQKGNDLIVVDALTKGDLNKIAEAVRLSGLRWLPCGSAGLAEATPEAYGFIIRKSLLAVSGSVSKVSLQQASYLSRRARTSVLKINLDAVMGCEAGRDEEIDRVSQEAINLIEGGRDVLVASALDQWDVIDEDEARSRYNIGSGEVKSVIADVLGEIVRRVMGEKSRRISGLILTGGEVASKILKVLNAKKLWVSREVLPGIPMVTVLNGAFKGLRVVTKAGAFGDEDALIQMFEHLRLS